MEAVRIGWSELSMSSGFTTVEYNLFENCDGDPEIISVKTCDDTIRYNTFRSCQGTLSLRHGNRSVVDGNFFFGEDKPGTGGIRIYGDDHQVTNNYFQDLTGTKWDAAITLTNGDYDGGSNLSKHFRINRALISHNTLVNNAHNIEIGFTNNGKYSKPPRDVKMSNNLVSGTENELIKVFTEPLNMIWQTNIMFAYDSATIGISKDSTEIYVCDPLLQWDNTFFRLASESPAVDYVQSISNVITDFEGQPRDDFPDAGCDEFSLAEIKNRPLMADDVGPFARDLTTHLVAENKTLPYSFFLNTYPNPFNARLKIEFSLNTSGFHSIQIFDLNGRLVKNLSGIFSSGKSRLSWDAKNMSSGLYIVSFDTQSRKVLLLK